MQFKITEVAIYYGTAHKYLIDRNPKGTVVEVQIQNTGPNEIDWEVEADFSPAIEALAREIGHSLPAPYDKFGIKYSAPGWSVRMHAANEALFLEMGHIESTAEAAKRLKLIAERKAKAIARGEVDPDEHIQIAGNGYSMILEPAA
jgi:hypothetical protein